MCIWFVCGKELATLHNQAHPNQPLVKTASGMASAREGWTLAGLNASENDIPLNFGWVFKNVLIRGAQLDPQTPSAFSFERYPLATGIAFGRAGAHEMGHYLLQMNHYTGQDVGPMATGFRGNEFFSPLTRSMWKFTWPQILKLMQACSQLKPIPLERAPLGNELISPHILSHGFGWNIFDLLQLLWGSMPSAPPPEEHLT